VKQDGKPFVLTCCAGHVSCAWLSVPLSTAYLLSVHCLGQSTSVVSWVTIFLGTYNENISRPAHRNPKSGAPSGSLQMCHFREKHWSFLNAIVCRLHIKMC
jgi:hypothetical protein